MLRATAGPSSTSPMPAGPNPHSQNTQSQHHHVRHSLRPELTHHPSNNPPASEPASESPTRVETIEDLFKRVFHKRTGKRPFSQNRAVSEQYDTLEAAHSGSIAFSGSRLQGAEPRRGLTALAAYHNALHPSNPGPPKVSLPARSGSVASTPAHVVQRHRRLLALSHKGRRGRSRRCQNADIWSRGLPSLGERLEHTFKGQKTKCHCLAGNLFVCGTRHKIPLLSAAALYAEEQEVTTGGGCVTRSCSFAERCSVVTPVGVVFSFVRGLFVERAGDYALGMLINRQVRFFYADTFRNFVSNREDVLDWQTASYHPAFGPREEKNFARVEYACSEELARTEEVPL